MRSFVLTSICGLCLGVASLYVWYSEMFREGPASEMWRRMNGKSRVGKNFAAVSTPAFSCLCFVGVIAFFLERIFAPDFILVGAGYLMLLLLLVFFVGLLPIRFPDFVYADWQYAKRHGLLDEKGNIDQGAWACHHAQRRGDTWW